MAPETRVPPHLPPLPDDVLLFVQVVEELYVARQLGYIAATLPVRTNVPLGKNNLTRLRTRPAPQRWERKACLEALNIEAAKHAGVAPREIEDMESVLDILELVRREHMGVLQ